MELTKVLEATVSSDQNELQAAQSYLEQAAQVNLPQFLVALVNELADGEKSMVARMAAGLHLKNHLTSKDYDVRIQKQQHWLTLDKNVRDHIKSMVLRTLGTETNRPAIAPQCIAAVACAEIPNKQWLELIDILAPNVLQGSTDALREQTLEAIGYICQDIDPEQLVSESNKILTAIVQGMRNEEPNFHIRLAATNALYNSLEFTKQNFERQNERHYIMQVVCEATQCTHNPVRVAGLQNLVKIMSLYYQQMEEYMGRALFAITMEAIKADADEISLQGIEFWSTVCDEEMDLAIEAAEAAENGRTPEQNSRFYVKGALQYLIPPLLECLTRQEEFDDEDDWNPCKAAGVCLMLMAQCCEDDVPPHVLQFVKDNLQSDNWKRVDAAVMAFGAILEGPSTKQLEPYVATAMPVLLKLMDTPNQNVVVQDSVAWTLGRICEILPQVATAENSNFLAPLVQTLLKGLDSEPRVASNVCWAFSSLSEAAFEAAQTNEEEDDPATYCLSKYFPEIVQKLLDVANRSEANQANLRSAAYEAVMELIKNSVKDCYETVQKTTLDIMQKLQQILNLEKMVASNERAQYNDLQSLLCATLQSVLRKMDKGDAVQIAGPVMVALAQMLNSPVPHQAGVQEDALMAVGTLVEVLKTDFQAYMADFKPYLIAGLQNKAEYQVCIAAVGLVGDISRALGAGISSQCDEYMRVLLENLADASVHRSVKPHIFSVFGDIALAIGPLFTNYLTMVINMVNQASQAQVDKSDYDMVDYLNELREGCLEAYTGIIQGLKGDVEGTVSPDVSLLHPHLPFILKFIETVAADQDHSDSNVASACGLVGDICTAFGAQVQPLLENQTMNELLQEGRRSKTQKTKQVATWATREVRKLKQPAN